MATHIDEKRLADLRVAAQVGINMAGLQPHTVQVRPDELAALVEEVFIARAQERPSAGVACRKCGCTDNDCSGCIERTGAPCFWVERDLCSACSEVQRRPITAEALAGALCIRHELPAALIATLSPDGRLNLGCAAVDHPISLAFRALANSIDIAIERGRAGFEGIAREDAIDIARRCAQAKPESYYAEPFEPHDWVVDAVLMAASTLPPVPANCGHCGETLSMSNKEAIRLHSMACEKSPAAQELKRLRAEVAMLRAELAEHYPVAITARAMMNDEASISDLREVSTRIGNSTLAARLEYLPARLRGGS